MTDMTEARDRIANDTKFRQLAGEDGVAAVLELSDEKLEKLGNILAEARG